ncbi:hypothetical protein NDU88_001316 [Pleurodeles waltl]|uniref:Uncharacterized protein n=1 Tax=Pleurodeles waltl TaxID=8319 RepID=A0AAV7USG0_PLEWA|nr:hypothetical protein NDU88_001316 [Pleurodeles waltl]
MADIRKKKIEHMDAIESDIPELENSMAQTKVIQRFNVFVCNSRSTGVRRRKHCLSGLPAQTIRHKQSREAVVLAGEESKR